MTVSPGHPRRVYLSLGPQALRLLAAGAAPTAGRRGCAVTELVRAASPGQDEEELEYEAMCVAATSPAITADDATPPERIVVVAADLPAAHVRDVLVDVVDDHAEAGSVEAQEAYAVELSEPVTLAQVVSIQVQDRADPESELLWYDVSELPAVLAAPD